VFGRRRSARQAADIEPADEIYAAEPEDEYEDEYEDEGDYEDQYDDEGEYSGGPGADAPAAEGGPWDAAEPYPALERVDLGSLHVPVGPEFEIQLVLAEQHGAWVTVRNGASELQLQAFAAPRRGSLWDDVRGEIAAEIAATGGGRTEERDGPFGVELLAQVPADPAAPGEGTRQVRFVGIDGPRWFLRGLFSGPATDSDADAAPLESLLRQVVVVRGDHPVPPRDLLELRLPPEAQQALAEEQARAQAEGGGEEEGRFQTPLNPFERGPEFTETR
jgi:Protein of unknown function (DUF3710)